nr:hypothetical protein [Candidatus Sigynarchaeota archaeon]
MPASSRAVASYSVFSALIVGLSIMSIPLPPPLAYFSFVPLVIFFLGVTLKPARAFAICSIGAVIGELLADIAFGYAGWLWLYLPGAFIARGIEGLMLSSLEKALVRGKDLAPRQKYVRELVIISIGGIWEFFGYVFVASLYYVIVLGMTLIETIAFYAWVLIDLTLIPVGIVVVYAVRRYFKEEYMDRLLFGDPSN